MPLMLTNQCIYRFTSAQPFINLGMLMRSLIYADEYRLWSEAWRASYVALCRFVITTWDALRKLGTITLQESSRCSFVLDKSGANASWKSTEGPRDVDLDRDQITSTNRCRWQEQPPVSVARRNMNAETNDRKMKMEITSLVGGEVENMGMPHYSEPKGRPAKKR